MAQPPAPLPRPGPRLALLAVLLLIPLPAPAELPGLPGPAPGAGHCLPAPRAGATPDQARLAAILARIEALSPGPDPLIAAAAGTAVCLEDRPMEGLGFYEPASQSLVLDARLPDALLLPILVHELRHVWQYRESYCPSVALSRDENLLQTYAMEADAQAIATLYAWRESEAGRPDAWTALEGHGRTRDIAARFANAARAGAAPAEAVAAAFSAWYDDAGRIETYYRATCSAWYDTLDKAHVAPGTGKLAAGHFDRLCQLPEGGRYPCEPRLPDRP